MQPVSKGDTAALVVILNNAFEYQLGGFHGICRGNSGMSLPQLHSYQDFLSFQISGLNPLKSSVEFKVNDDPIAPALIAAREANAA